MPGPFIFSYTTDAVRSTVGVPGVIARPWQKITIRMFNYSQLFTKGMRTDDEIDLRRPIRFQIIKSKIDKA